MRTAPSDLIWDLWDQGGHFIGEDGAPHGRVTVEIGWQLRKSAGATIGSYAKGPIRWFQASDNSQVETEVPNILSIDIDRTIDVDSATCRITMFNQRMIDNEGPIEEGTAGESFGRPGYYWPGRGEAAVSGTLWGHQSNEWNDVLQPNALIRTYQGYGGRYNKEFSEALQDGNIIQTGTWLVDSISMDAKSGTMTISCRDVAKLLIDQQTYPPLVPSRKSQGANLTNPRLAYYPLHYFRWVYRHHDVVPYGNTVYHTGFTSIEGQFALNNTDTSTNYTDPDDVVYGGNRAIDGDDIDTYWLSVGRPNQGVEYITFDLLDSLNIGAVNVIPYAGNYKCYVSVMSNGSWASNYGSAVTPPNGSIPYVAVQGIGWERAITIDLNGPGTEGFPDFSAWPNVTKIRLTFEHLAKVGPNPPYRAGVRDVQIGTWSKRVSGDGRVVVGIGRGSNDPDVTKGYWVVGSDGGVYNFGGLRFYGSEGGKHLNGEISSIATNVNTGKGYRLCGRDGGVFCFGDLYYHGSIPGGSWHTGHGALGEEQFVEQIENGDGGPKGYYLLRSDGKVDEYGTATWHGDATPDAATGELYYASAMGVKTSAPRGYWIMFTGDPEGDPVDVSSLIQPQGGASLLSRSIGGPSETWDIELDGLMTAIEVTPSGEGYWTVGALGRVRAYGDAVHYGGLPQQGVTIVLGEQKGITDMVRTASGLGYWLVGQDGGVYAFGDAQFSGSLPEQYNNISDGNYQDYTDIVRDLLLWSGWWFRDPTNPSLNETINDVAWPPIFGNLESTGIYAPSNLTEDFFDKKPIIDVINTLKEIVGYINFADEIGAYQFKSPNVWTIGNFLDTGVPTSRMAVIDEAKQIISYQVTVADANARSSIIIATEDPALNLSGTKSVTISSQWAADILRGVVRPALWVNGKFLNSAVQNTMAHLIDLHLFMQSRQGSLTMPANPIIQIDDQVQIYERGTSEAFIHYVRGYNTHMDLYSGEYTQTLQTHWMGDGNAWHLSNNPAQNAEQLEDQEDVEDEAPVFAADSPGDGIVSSFFLYTFTANGSPPPTFTVTSGTLPPGLVLQTNGQLSGTPTESGSYEFQVTASNGIGSDSTDVSMDVAAGTGVPPSLQNDNPPNGTVGTAYSYTFTATGIPSPHFNVLSGDEVPGLILHGITGILSGTPTTPGTFVFEIEAFNSEGNDTVECSVIISSGGTESDPPPVGGFFSILPVGDPLPGGMTAAGADAAAAAAVNYSSWEPRPANNVANHTIVSNNLAENTLDFDATWNSTYLPRVSGDFEGTTDEIIQWAAYKWGWSDELVRAQAIQESDWHQDAVGDFEPESNGHRVFDRVDDPSPTSFSIIQNKWYFHPPIVELGGDVVDSSSADSSYPSIRQSTAFALDYFLAMLRGIYDGHSTYLNGGGMAASGDEWGAIGSWFSGDWHDSQADGYILDVQSHFFNRPWLDSGFPEGTSGGGGGGGGGGGEVNRARPFASDSMWNTPTPGGQTWHDETCLHELADTSFRHWWVASGSMAVWWSSPTDPEWTFDLPEYRYLPAHRDRDATVFTMRAPENIEAAVDADHILFVIDPETGDYAEVWQAEVNHSTHTVTNISGETGWAVGNAITGPGGGTLANNDGCRAANFSWFGGLITAEEINNGEIDHALALILPWDMLMGGGNTGYEGGGAGPTPAYIDPATAWDFGFWSGPIQMGSKIGVPAGVPQPSGLSPIGVMVFNALQTYGAYVGDFCGGQWGEFCIDANTLTETQMLPLFAYWNYGGSSDMEKIGPLLRVAD